MPAGGRACAGDSLLDACINNKSLACLGNVLAAAAKRSDGRTSEAAAAAWESRWRPSRLAADRSGINTSSHAFVPYRDSRLTFLLKDCFGGNSKSLLIATIVRPAEFAFAMIVTTAAAAATAAALSERRASASSLFTTGRCLFRHARIPPVRPSHKPRRALTLPGELGASTTSRCACVPCMRVPVYARAGFSCA